MYSYYLLCTYLTQNFVVTHVTVDTASLKASSMGRRDLTGPVNLLHDPLLEQILHVLKHNVALSHHYWVRTHILQILWAAGPNCRWKAIRILLLHNDLSAVCSRVTDLNLSTRLGLGLLIMTCFLTRT